MKKKLCRKNIKCISVAIIFIFLQLDFSYAKSNISIYYTAGEPGLAGIITDAENGLPLPARIILKNQGGEVIGSYYRSYPGFFSAEDATFSKNMQPGEYLVEFRRGIDYLSQTHSIKIKKDSLLHIKIALTSWVPLRKLGWVNGDAHAHLYTDKRPDDEMLYVVRQICRAQGIDFISTNQGWAGYNEDNWREGYAKYCDENFLLTFGAEMPKYRTGHTWWINLKSCRHFFESAMDSVYENRYYLSPKTMTWQFENLPFPNIPDIELVPRFKAAENAVACIPHPTSWWWQKRGDIEKYTTNVCEYLSFSLLAGGIWDGFVIMGYDHDHYFYQNLWFNILNLGYRLTPVAELDGGYGQNNKFPYGSMRVYYKIGENMCMDSVAVALRTGRTFVTSGPIILANVDDIYNVGDVISADGKTHLLNIEAFASGEAEDYISYIIVFRNGKIFKLWDVRQQQLRTIRKSLQITESDQAWYVIKIYGKDAWENSENLDVMEVCKKIQNGSFKGEVKRENNNAMTSPFYFRPENSHDPKPLQAKINLSLIFPQTGKLVRDAKIILTHYGNKIAEIYAADGQASFEMPINAMLNITIPGFPTIHRGLYLDYPPHRHLIENFANGSWLEHNNWKSILSPGQVPWDAFQFDSTRTILSNVDWKIEIKQNERDALWDQFDKIFQ